MKTDAELIAFLIDLHEELICAIGKGIEIGRLFEARPEVVLRLIRDTCWESRDRLNAEVERLNKKERESV